MWMGVLLFGLLLAGTASAETLTGRASVVDGDTIEIAGERVRLHGIDAPEGRQQCRDADGRPWHCGREAAFALDEFLAQSRPTHCSLLDRDRWGRFVATCIRNDSMDVNEWLVKHGWALDWPHYSGGAYSDAQEVARAAGHGIWQSEFIDPWEWRDGVRLAWTVSVEPRDADCVIKGNISSRGERIYHVPGGQFYEQTVIDESAGQRWFCTEAEARGAGWRPSQR